MPVDQYGNAYYTVGGIKTYWSPPSLRKGPVSSVVLNAQNSIEDQLINVPAEGQPIPVVYGHRQVGGKLFALDYTNGTWTAGFIICLGEINAYLDVFVNGESTMGSPSVSVPMNTYKGTTSQTADGYLSAAISGYSDNMIITGTGSPRSDIGIAYVVIQYTDEQYETIPEVVAEIQGLKVWNPTASPPVTEYSTNPALHLADYVSNSIYGMGRNSDDTSLITLATRCDDTTQTSPNEVLRRSGIVIDDPRPTEEWRETLRAYAGAWTVDRGNTVYYIPDAPGSSVMFIDESDIVEGSLRIKKRDSSQVPTVVRATYTDTTNNKWRSALSEPAKASGVDAGTTPWRESRVNLEGIDRHSQAYRECVERLNKLTLQDLEVSWTQFDESLELEIGDIVTLSHPLFGSPQEKPLRIIQTPQQSSPGRWEMVGEEYDPAVYSGAVVAATTYSDGSLPNGGKPTAPSNLTATSVPFLDADGFWKTRFQISWTAPADGSLVTHYYIKVEQGDVSPNAPVWDATIPGTQTVTATPALETGASYTISVAAINAVIRGDFVVSAATLNGNSTPPSNVADLTVQTTGESVFARWGEIAGAVKYRVKYWSGGGSWATGTEVDVNFGRTAAFNLTAGSYTLGVKAVDSLGNESGTADTQAFTTSATSTVTTFFQGQSTDGIPTSTAAGQTWYDSDDDQHPYRAQNAGVDYINGSPLGWVSIKDDTLYGKVDLSYVAVVTTVQSSNFNGVAQNRYPIDTSGGEVTMTLPNNPSAGMRIQFFDVTGDFDVYHFIIAQNTGSPQDPIVGIMEDLRVDARYYAGELQYVNSTEGWTLA